MSTDSVIIGISDHGGWAVLVTVRGDGTLLDRRRIALVDEELPKIPHHSEAQALPLDEAVALVQRGSDGGTDLSIEGDRVTELYTEPDPVLIHVVLVR